MAHRPSPYVRTGWRPVLHQLGYWAAGIAVSLVLWAALAAAILLLGGPAA